MGKTRNEIDDELRSFVARQHVFFVATAPLARDGHVNCSPKGLDTLRLLGPRTIAYLDYTGSGVETIAHVRENGRIVLMLCAFAGAPRIVRFYGEGRVVEPRDPEYATLAPAFAPGPGARAIVVVAIERIMDSCGFGVPLLRWEGDRGQLGAWAERKGEAGAAEYRRTRNARSLDGLPGLDPGDGGPV